MHLFFSWKKIKRFLLKMALFHNFVKKAHISLFSCFLRERHESFYYLRKKYPDLTAARIFTQSFSEKQVFQRETGSLFFKLKYKIFWSCKSGINGNFCKRLKSSFCCKTLLLCQQRLLLPTILVYTKTIQLKVV